MTAAAKTVALAKLVDDARRAHRRRGWFVGAAAAQGKPIPLLRMVALAARALGSRGSR